MDRARLHSLFARVADHAAGRRVEDSVRQVDVDMLERAADPHGRLRRECTDGNALVPRTCWPAAPCAYGSDR